MRELRGKVAVITGGASGIGRAIAERFAREGMKMVLADVEAPVLEKTVAEMSAAGHEVIGVLTDVSKAESVEQLAKRTIDAYGKVHLLCNNAGVSGGRGSSWGTIWEATRHDWEWIAGVNFFGVANGIRVFVPIMLAQNEEGHVVNTASVAGLMPGNNVYGATKAAVVSMSESLYKDFRRHNTKLNVTCLCPTVVDSGFRIGDRNRPPEFQDADNPLATEEAREAYRAFAAKGLKPAEVAEMVYNAVKENQLYLITAETISEPIRDRLDAILNRRNLRDFPMAGPFAQMEAARK
ncbi:MAG: SDR family NAD(P)-dependent oxidoreductase [Chloroflexota bacterium]|nr:SDR family NAD(P)-dependent oxidoreductase [Chloroflexota bacterium]